MSKPKKSSKLNILIVIGLTALVLYFALKDDFGNIAEQLLKINIWWLLVAVLFKFIFWAFRGMGLAIFTKKIKKDIKFASAYQLTVRTQFINGVTPFGSGGKPYQVYYLVKSGMSVSSASSVILQNSIVYQIALVFLGALAVISNYFMGYFANAPWLSRLVILGFSINTFVIIVLFSVAFAEKTNKKLVRFWINILCKLRIVKDRDKKQAEWDESISNFHESAEILLANKKDFALAIMLNLASLILLFITPLILLWATGDFSSFGLYESMVASAYVLLIGAFVPSPGGTGGLEFGFITFFGTFIAGPQLVAIMLLWRFITYHFSLIAGAISLHMKKVEI